MRKGPMIPGNMNNMMKQVQKMQKDLQEKQNRVENEEFEAQAGGGAIKVVVNGKKELLSIEFKPEIVDPQDVEMLQDLVLVAVNDALKQAEDKMNAVMGNLAGGFGGLGGLF